MGENEGKMELKLAACTPKIKIERTLQLQSKVKGKVI